MSDEEFQPLGPEEEHRLRALLRGAPGVTADPAFRARLRHDFMSGRIAAARRNVIELPAGSRRGFPRLAWVAGAAAAMFLAVSILALNRGPAWQLGEVRGEGIAIVDQKPISLTHAEELSRALRPGSRLRVPPGTEVEIVAPGTMLIQLVSGADLLLPKTPGRWFGRKVDAVLAAGELRIQTGRKFAGAGLAVETPEARVFVTGTTLAIICEAPGTCVCVLEGKVLVGEGESQGVEVEAGRRRFVFRDGRKSETDDMRPMERDKLSMLLSREPR